jgi:hypothetical protein
MLNRHLKIVIRPQKSMPLGKEDHRSDIVFGLGYLLVTFYPYYKLLLVVNQKFRWTFIWKKTGTENLAPSSLKHRQSISELMHSSCRDDLDYWLIEECYMESCCRQVLFFPRKYISGLEMLRFLHYYIYNHKEVFPKKELNGTVVPG